MGVKMAVKIAAVNNCEVASVTNGIKNGFVRAISIGYAVETPATAFIAKAATPSFPNIFLSKKINGLVKI